MRSLLVIALLAGCGTKAAAPPPVVQPTPSASTATATTAAPPSDCAVDAIAARITAEWGSPDAPKASFAGQVMGKVALKGWSAYAEMELIDNYARGMIEAHKAGLKGSIFANAWKRMGVVVKEVGAEAVDERLEQVKRDHPDVPLDAKAFTSVCSWPAGC